MTANCEIYSKGLAGDLTATVKVAPHYPLNKDLCSYELIVRYAELPKLFKQIKPGSQYCKICCNVDTLSCVLRLKATTAATCFPSDSECA
jgi:hypothetical protein